MVENALELNHIRTLLPGTWRLTATNVSMWLDGTRRDPEREYAIRAGSPLRLEDRMNYRDDRGRERIIAGTDRWTGDRFHWRGGGAARLLANSWTISWLADDVLVVHRAGSRLARPGVEVAIRVGSDHPELRRRIARDPAAFGLTLEQFASLTWLDHVPAL